MNAGGLPHLITIEQNTGERDAAGQLLQNWTELMQRHARVTPASGKEALVAGHRAAEITHVVRMRFTDGLLPQMRVMFRGRVLEIVAVIDPDERRRELTLHCVERA